jgi:hypothetical protein
VFRIFCRRGYLWTITCCGKYWPHDISNYTTPVKRSYVHSLDSLPYPTAHCAVVDHLKLSLYLYYLFTILFYLFSGFHSPRELVNVLSEHAYRWTIALRMWATLMQEPPPPPADLTSRECQPSAPCCWQN